ncbi:MAG: DUF1015 domain-containing protein [Saprospiraceae bacterium]|nr:DUF1015 domain-containing protein [Saprospiraceae bacterium]
MRIEPFQAVYPNFDLIASTDAFFDSVKYDYPDFKKDGFFNKTETAALYVFEIESPNRHHRGIIASVNIEDYIDGKIVKHEKTLPSKEQSMTNLLLHRKAMIKPVLLTYPRMEELDKIMDEYTSGPPLYSIHFAERNEEHRTWKIRETERIEKLKEVFSKMKNVYIADGHHRCSTSSKLYQTQNNRDLDLDFSLLLSAFLSFDDLIIHEYNRVINYKKKISALNLLAELSKYCLIKRMKGPFQPDRKHELSMFLDKEWFRLRWKKKVLSKYEDEPVVLDTTILTDIVIKKILKIKKVRSNKRINYVEGTLGPQGFVTACKKKKKNVGFGLFPVNMHEIKKMSDLGKTLPPKSTWFEPRMKNGLISQEF